MGIARESHLYNLGWWEFVISNMCSFLYVHRMLHLTVMAAKLRGPSCISAGSSISRACFETTIIHWIKLLLMWSDQTLIQAEFKKKIKKSYHTLHRNKIPNKRPNFPLVNDDSFYTKSQTMQKDISREGCLGEDQWPSLFFSSPLIVLYKWCISTLAFRFICSCIQYCT